MDIIMARRIVAYCDNFHFSVTRLAQQFECSTTEAAAKLATARSTVNVADARKAVASLNDAARRLNVSTYELLEMYA